MSLEKVKAALYKLQRIVLAFCGIGMVVLLTANGLGRYILKTSIVWGDEVTRILFVWGCFIGITNAFINDAHIGFDSLAKLKPWTLKLSKLANGLCLVVVGYIVLYYGYKFTHQVGRFPLPAAGLPIAVLYIAGVVAGAIWLLIGIVKILSVFQISKQQKEGVEV